MNSINRLRQLLSNSMGGMFVSVIVLSVAMLILLVLLTGGDPATAFQALVKGAFGGRNLYNLQASLTRATLIGGMALAALLAFRAGIFNIGGEGQLVLGGLASAVVALHLPGPPWLTITVAFLAAIAAGGTWAVLAGIMRFFGGVPILVGTLLLNYPARYFSSYVVNHPLRDVMSGMAQTHRLPRDHWLPFLGQLDLHIGLPLMLLVALLVMVFLRNTVAGYSTRMIGDELHFARNIGIEVRSYSLKIMFASGGIAGLTGAVAVLGDQHRFIDGMLVIPLYAWSGVVSALMVNLSIVGALGAAFFFAALQSAATGLERAAELPREVAQILQALIILLVAARISSVGLRRD